MAFALFLGLSVSLWAQVPAGERLSQRMEARAGETCLICNRPVQSGDVAYLAGGQRAALHAAECCEGPFLAQPARHMAKMRPNDILFSGTANIGLPAAWLWPGLYLLLGLATGGFCAHAAVRKGRPPIRWFFTGLILPVAACIFLAFFSPPADSPALPAGLRKVPKTREPARCPGCGRENHPAATDCAACGAEMVPTAVSEVRTARAS